MSLLKCATLLLGTAILTGCAQKVARKEANGADAYCAGRYIKVGWYEATQINGTFSIGDHKYKFLFSVNPLKSPELNPNDLSARRGTMADMADAKQVRGEDEPTNAKSPRDRPEACDDATAERGKFGRSEICHLRMARVKQQCTEQRNSAVPPHLVSSQHGRRSERCAISQGRVPSSLQHADNLSRPEDISTRSAL
jgi:hypothetical protein